MKTFVQILVPVPAGVLRRPGTGPSQRAAPVTPSSSWEEFVARRLRGPLAGPLAVTGLVAGLLALSLNPSVAGLAGAADRSPAAPAADTQPPTPPPNPRATSVTETTVGLAWDAATDNVGVVGYNIMKQGQQLQSLGNV